MTKRRTQAQKAAVATVRAAAKKLIAEIDADRDPRWQRFDAYFHLDRCRVSDFMECKTTYPNGRIENLSVTIGGKLYANVTGNTRQ